MQKHILFIDAESDGLYGDFISVAGIYTDNLGNEIEHFYYGVKQDNLKISEPWVRENVIPKLGDYEEYDNEFELLEAVWKKWEKYRENTIVIGDVIYPVEARLFRKCVEHNMDDRKCKGPFPLMDLSSMMYAKGIDFHIDRNSFSGLNDENQQHNCLYDTRTSVEIYKKLIVVGEYGK